MFFYASKHSYKRCITFVAPVEIYLVSLEVLAPRAWRYATRVAIYGLRVNTFHHIGTKTLILKIVLRYFVVMPHSATAEEMMGPGQKYDNNAMGDSGSLQRDYWNRFGNC